MTRHEATLLLSIVAAAGCALSHGRPEGDAGPVRPDAARLDAGRRDAGLLDASSDACVSEPEACNGADDDCDGLVDDGDALCAASPHASASCIAGRCELSCDDGFADCNGDTSDGCESPLDTRAHCGSCETQCPLTANCVEGECVRERVIDLEVDTRHACVLLESGRALCWGQNDQGQLGTSSFDPPIHYEPVEVTGLSDAVDLAIGYSTSCALARDRRVLCWGNQNLVGLLGDGSRRPRPVPGEVAGIDDALEGGVVADHACVLRSDHTVWCWGRNAGCFGGPHPETSGVPVPVEGVADARRLFVLYGGVCAELADGRLWCWADHLATSRFIAAPAVPQPTSLVRPWRVSGRLGAVCWIDSEHHSHCAGPADYRGVLGEGGSLPEGVRAIDLDGGTSMSAVATNDGRVFAWGSADWSLWPSPGLRPIQTPIAGATRVGAGDRVICAQVGPSSIRCLGDNEFGQLGDGTGISSWAPVAPVGLE